MPRVSAGAVVRGFSILTPLPRQARLVDTGTAVSGVGIDLDAEGARQFSCPQRRQRRSAAERRARGSFPAPVGVDLELLPSQGQWGARGRVKETAVDPEQKLQQLAFVGCLNHKDAGAVCRRETPVIQIVAIQGDERATQLLCQLIVASVCSAPQERVLKDEEDIPMQLVSHRGNETGRHVGVRVDPWARLLPSRFPRQFRPLCAHFPQKARTKNSLTSSAVDTATTTDYTWLWWTAGSGAALVALWLLAVWMKGRPFATGDIFRASRLSRGNRLLPTQVLITRTSVVHFTPAWIGRQEESIHMAHIASVKIQTGVLLSDVLIETSGGQSPIRCHGHRKSDATRMKLLIEQHQNDYFRAGGTAAARGAALSSPSSAPDHA